MNPIKKKFILITAGPTREFMDPVRFLTNPSSGETGLVLAEELRKAGARPTVVAGPVSGALKKSIPVVNVTTAQEMHKAVLSRLPRSDVFISTAAVCDYRFAHPARQKLKKNQSRIQVDMVKNPDILLAAGTMKAIRNERPLLLIGFALETTRLRESMRIKLKHKNLDLIIGNGPDSFGASTIKSVWLEKNGAWTVMPRLSKRNLAKRIVRWIESRLRSRS